MDASRAITVIVTTVVGLTFLFGFGNVLNLALRLGVPVWVAPLIAPAVDLSILGLLLAVRHLTLHGCSAHDLQPLRRFTLFVSVITLALNVADPLLTGQYGKAAFDAVGPVLLIGWAEVGPGLLEAIAQVRRAPETALAERPAEDDEECGDVVRVESQTPSDLTRARLADARHWATRKRPITADALRTELEISTESARALVAVLRAEVAEMINSRQSAELTA
ncbi:hypothetical protein Lesp02_42120 [Lentzea sp. NBRC 105346]|nr:hypothetical protein Lesp02_42120 [Lentzea sp. NBRC 105346]